MRVASGHGVSEVYGSGGVGVGGDLGGGLFAELDVPAEAGQVLVAGFGLELGGGAAVDGKVLAAECRSWWSVQPFCDAVGLVDDEGVAGLEVGQGRSEFGSFGAGAGGLRQERCGTASSAFR